MQILSNILLQNTYVRHNRPLCDKINFRCAGFFFFPETSLAKILANTSSVQGNSVNVDQTTNYCARDCVGRKFRSEWTLRGFHAVLSECSEDQGEQSVAGESYNDAPAVQGVCECFMAVTFWEKCVRNFGNKSQEHLLHVHMYGVSESSPVISGTIGRFLQRKML